MPSDFNKKVYILPKLGKGSYTTLMKLVSNSLKFDLSDPAKFRLCVLDYYYKYGWKAAIEAYKIGKSTLYDWKGLFEKSQKRVNSLVPRSTKPHNTRVMQTDPRLVEFIKSVRVQYGNVSKYKLKVFVDEYAKELSINSLSVSVIGKVIKRRNFFFERKVKQKRKRLKLLYPRLKRAPKENLPGYIEMDSVTIYVVSRRYYFITAIDVATKVAWVKLTTSLNSSQALSALQEFMSYYKHPLRVIQTDNGHEFLGEFTQYLGKLSTKHEFIYPRSPKVNGVVERFNRTIQEEFIQREQEDIYNTDQFSQKLTKYLIWYNTKRPHQALNYMTPEKYTKSLTDFPKCV